MIVNYWIPKFGKLILPAISTEAIDTRFISLKSFNIEDIADAIKNKILAVGKTVFEEAKR